MYSRRGGESQAEFTKRLALMQEEINRTSQRLEDYKLRQGEVVKKWSIDKNVDPKSH